MSSRVKTPYFKWRGGRPRWEPGPGVRKRGFHGRDLKDASGAWLAQGAARDVCDKLNASIREAPGAAPLAADRAIRNVSNLILDYKQSPNYKRRTESTRRGYDSLMGIVDDWAGDTLAAAMTKANIGKWHQAQEALRGGAQANALLRMVKILLYYAADDLEWIVKVRARKIALAETEGRLMIWPMEAITAFVAIVDFIGQPDMGDACLLGCLTGQSRKDLITLPRGERSDGIYRFKKRLRRAKTGREVKVPLVAQLDRRITASRQRADERFPNVTHTTELVDVETGMAFHTGGKHFERRFRQCRMFAAGRFNEIEGGIEAMGPLPDGWHNLPFNDAIADLLFQDLRDTAVTWLALAGCTIPEIATITGHSLATVTAILDKHYLVRDDAFAIAGGKKLEAFLTAAKFG
jgi:hypothetical protein